MTINNDLEIAHPLSGSSSTCSFGGIGIIWKCWFLSRGETGVPREKPLGARERTNKKLQTNIWCQHWDSNLGHIGGKQVLSPLHHPCSDNNVQNISRTRSL